MSKGLSLVKGKGFVKVSHFSVLLLVLCFMGLIVICVLKISAVQVKPLGHSVGVSVGTGIGAPCLTSTPIKRPRMEDTVFEESSTYTSNQCSDVTYEPDVTQESIEK